ncbi:hypothetical protein ROHU_026005 [Labeo rohita]|uniref:Uncharacterized protein n=1 Tax=Labeo rohita TaxID=84645 RepID=A0A498MH63_LABRO|nr:hypothetical protein ROHU_031421 [Labeo rohita]RXN18712.1 hypothetical protein ROHU_026005 [Labeo rohita]
MPAEPVVPLLTSAGKSVRKGTGGALRNKKMLRLLILFLILRGAGNTVRFDLTPNENFGEVPGSDKSTGDDANGG